MYFYSLLRILRSNIEMQGVSLWFVNMEMLHGSYRNTDLHQDITVTWGTARVIYIIIDGILKIY